jgi:hypothetical protein
MIFLVFAGFVGCILIVLCFRQECYYDCGYTSLSYIVKNTYLLTQVDRDQEWEPPIHVSEFATQSTDELLEVAAEKGFGKRKQETLKKSGTLSYAPYKIILRIENHIGVPSRWKQLCLYRLIFRTHRSN